MKGFRGKSTTKFVAAVVLSKKSVVGLLPTGAEERQTGRKMIGRRETLFIFVVLVHVGRSC